jgi:tetratricopeptide (TPR) repeat protein
MKGRIYGAAALLPLCVGFAFSACRGPVPAEETLVRYAKARAFYGEGSFDEAVAMLGDVKNFFPGLVLRGKAEYFAGRGAEAELSLRRALKIKSEAAEAGRFLVRVLREKGEYEEAAALAESLLASDPNDVRLLRLFAGIESDRGPDGQAAAAVLLDRAAEASSESALVFVDRAKLRWIRGKGREALEDIARAKILLPRDSPMARSMEKLENTIREAVK